jgi:hypothetical protein
VELYLYSPYTPPWRQQGQRYLLYPNVTTALSRAVSVHLYWSLFRKKTACLWRVAEKCREALLIRRPPLFCAAICEKKPSPYIRAYTVNSSQNEDKTTKKKLIQWNLSSIEPGHTGELSQAKNFYAPDNLQFPRIQTSSSCMKRCLPATEKNFDTWGFRYRQVSLYSRRRITNTCLWTLLGIPCSPLEDVQRYVLTEVKDHYGNNYQLGKTKDVRMYTCTEVRMQILWR